MFIAKNKDHVIFARDTKEDLLQALQCVIYDTIEETDKDYIFDGEEYVLLDEIYLQKKTKEREKEFYTHFIKTSLGNYRLEPKGYANAQQSMDVTNTMATTLGGLTEQLTNLVIFYETPDFTKAEECTEEWLVAHQKNPSVMTLEEWQKFYFEFCQLYAMQQYKTTTVNGGNNESTTNTEQSTDVPNEVDTKENNTKLNEN